VAERDVPEELGREPVEEITTAAGGATVVRLAGQLDLHNAEQVREALLREAAGEPQRLVVDLEEVTFLDSTTLGILVEARSRLRNRDAFRLAAPGLEVRRALEVSGLDHHFSVHETVDDALGATV
jgi:anti-sigma B factor antagonist